MQAQKYLCADKPLTPSISNISLDPLGPVWTTEQPRSSSEREDVCSVGMS